MKIYNNITLIILCLILLSVTVSAEIEPDYLALQDLPFNISIPCSLNGYYCQATTNCNSSIKYPNKYSNIGFVFRDKQFEINGGFLNIMMNHTDTRYLGDYYGDAKCYDSATGLNASTSYIVRVTYTGSELPTSKALMYILILFIGIILLIVLIYFGITLPYVNPKDQFTGYIIAIENLKYLKIFCWAMTYLVIMLIAYFSWMISIGYLEMDFLGNLFKFWFYGMLVVLLPSFIFGTFIVIANAVRDSQVGGALSRGLR